MQLQIQFLNFYFNLFLFLSHCFDIRGYLSIFIS